MQWREINRENGKKDSCNNIPFGVRFLNIKSLVQNLFKAWVDFQPSLLMQCLERMTGE